MLEPFYLYVEAPTQIVTMERGLQDRTINFRSKSDQIMNPITIIGLRLIEKSVLMSQNIANH